MHSPMRLPFGVPGPLAALLGCLSLGLAPAVAQTPQRPAEVPYLASPVPFPSNSPAPAPESSAAPGPARAPSKLDDLKQREQELATIRNEQRNALGNEAKLKREVESLGDDRRKLNGEMIEAAARIRAVEEQIAKAEERLAPIDEREQVLRQSLVARRGVLIEVLAALQRIGRHPPPAIVVKAEDALQSVRSALLLGALLPEMQQEAESLLVDLGELARLRKTV